MTLAKLPVGSRGVIQDMSAVEQVLQERMRALGLRVGKEVSVLRRVRLGGTLHVRVGSTELMMRPQEARLIELASFGE